MVGFDAKNKDSLPAVFHCRRCALIFREPCQLNCGHRLCRTCTDTIEGEMVKCPDCSEETPKNEILPDRGFRNDMKELPMECALCAWAGAYKEYEVHLQSVHANPSCPFCEARFDSVERLEMHKRLECEKIAVPCALNTYGCLDSVLRVEMKQHYLTVDHPNTLNNLIRRVTTTEPPEFGDRAFGRKIDSAPNLTTSTSGTTPTTDQVNHNMQEVYEMINVLAGGIQALNDDTQRLRIESIRMQNAVDSVTQEMSSLKLSVQEQSTSLGGIKLNQDILHQDVASLKRKIDDLQNVSYDGTLIWKILSFREKMMNPQAKRRIRIDSSVFFSSPYGYKMHARLYLHGGQNGPRTQMSVCFILMSGDFDPILTFPFRYKVAFCIYDLTSAKRHFIRETLLTINTGDRREYHLDQPIRLSWLATLPSPYIRDDTMQIEVMINFLDWSTERVRFYFHTDRSLGSEIRFKLTQEERHLEPDDVRKALACDL